MRHFTAIGCIVALCAAFTGNANAANYTGALDLTDFLYPVTVNGSSTDAAADIMRFDLGTGWSGEMELLLTASDYNSVVTSLGFALTRNPNDTLFGDPSAFLDLVDATDQQQVTDFFNANVIDWVFYGYGAPYILPGVTSNLTDTFNPPLQFDPNEHYYAFVAGGSAILPATVNVDLAVSATTSPASVPIPAAVWLFGSGIVGLIGIAKRKKV